MANFTKELPRWEAVGVVPPESLQKDGWKASQRPPADYFNWFFSKTYFALKELQEESARTSHLEAHKEDKANPHSVTATQVGLGNLLNQKQATKVEFDAHYEDGVRHVTASERSLWNSKAAGTHTHQWNEIQNVPFATLSAKGITQLVDSISSTDTTSAATPNSVKQAYDRGSTGIADAAASKKITEEHIANKANPHGTTKTHIGLNNVENYAIASTSEAQNGTASNKYMTPLLVFEAIKTLQAVKSVNGKTGTVVLSKSDVGLTNVDNIQQATKAEFNTHTANKSNPHSVTANQVGSYTKTETDTALDKKITNKQFSLTNTSGSNRYKWTKFASSFLNRQYSSSQFTVDILSGSNGYNYGQQVRLYARNKQQNALGSATYVSLELFNQTSHIKPDDFRAVVVKNDAAGVVVDYYMRVNIEYGIIFMNPQNEVGETVSYFASQPFLDEVPSGTSFTATPGGNLKLALENTASIEEMNKNLNTHNNDNTRHITAAERTNWNAKASSVVLFSGQAAYPSVVNLSESTNGFKKLLMTFDFKGNKGTVEVDIGDAEFSWSTTNIASTSFVAWEIGQITVSRANDLQYRLRSSVSVTMEGKRDMNITSIRLLSVTGIR